MQAQELTTNQWWIVALASSALLVAAVHFCVRNKKATLYSLIGPASGAISVTGFSRLRDHAETESLVMFSLSVISVALLLVALRADVRKHQEKARTGERYEIPKWKVNLYAVLVVAFPIIAMILLL